MDVPDQCQYNDKHMEVQKQNSCLNLAASPELPYTTIFGPDGLLSLLAYNQKNEVEVAVHKGRKRKRSSFVQELDPEPLTSIRLESFPIAKCIRSVPEKRRPVEFALLTDEILDEIMTSLNTSDLYSCRLVSKHWKKIASTKLWKQKQITINLVYEPKDRTWFKGVCTNSKGWIPSHSLDDESRKLKLQELTLLLKSWDTSSFPCRKFQIINGSLSNNALQSFLNTYGKYIKNLTFHFLSSSRRVKELVLLNHIEHLLTVQTENLESLTLRLNFLVRCQDDNDEDGHSFLKPSSRKIDPEFHKIDLIHGKSKISKRGINNEKLKFFDFGPLSSGKVLDSVIRISPNLKDVSLHFSDYHFFVQPLNQLHLLKRFDFGVDTQANSIENAENFRLIEIALDSRSLNKPIKLTKLSIDFCLLLDRMGREEEFRLCVVNVINMILQLSWDSLESIVFVDYGLNILTGIKWPVIMPNVVAIGLCPFDTCGLEIFSWNFVNCNFQMQHTFPRLQSLRMDVTRLDITSGSDDLEFEKKYINFGPVPSVKFLDVQVLDSFYDNSSFDEMGQRIFNFPDKFYRSLRSMFPEASFKDSNLELFPETPVKFKSEVSPSKF